MNFAAVALERLFLWLKLLWVDSRCHQREVKIKWLKTNTMHPNPHGNRKFDSIVGVSISAAAGIRAILAPGGGRRTVDRRTLEGARP